jgi:hypothetical protein
VHERAVVEEPFVRQGARRVTVKTPRFAEEYRFAAQRCGVERRGVTREAAVVRGAAANECSHEARQSLAQALFGRWGAVRAPKLFDVAPVACESLDGSRQGQVHLERIFDGHARLLFEGRRAAVPEEALAPGEIRERRSVALAGALFDTE